MAKEKATSVVLLSRIAKPDNDAPLKILEQYPQTPRVKTTPGKYRQLHVFIPQELGLG